MMEAVDKVSNEVTPRPFETRRNVIVTGFGPFTGHYINASWEAVKLLPEMGIDKEIGINLIIENVPVQYDVVEKRIPKLWDDYDPLLVIHVGVSGLANKLTLECCANRSEYKTCDIEGQKPESGSCAIGVDETIHCTFDVSSISRKINSMKDHDIETTVSTNAGRYLCEYTYYASLCQDKSRCIFIHVPDINKPYSTKQTAIGLCKIIKLLVEELRQGV